MRLPLLFGISHHPLPRGPMLCTTKFCSTPCPSGCARPRSPCPPTPAPNSAFTPFPWLFLTLCVPRHSLLCPCRLLFLFVLVSLSSRLRHPDVPPGSRWYSCTCAALLWPSFGLRLSFAWVHACSLDFDHVLLAVSACGHPSGPQYTSCIHTMPFVARRCRLSLVAPLLLSPSALTHPFPANSLCHCAAIPCCKLPCYFLHGLLSPSPIPNNR